MVPSTRSPGVRGLSQKWRISPSFSRVSVILLVPAELVIALVEAGLYCKLLQGRSKARSFVYGLTANAISALLGW